MIQHARSQDKTMAFASIGLWIAPFFVMGARLLHARNRLKNGGFDGGPDTGWGYNASHKSDWNNSLPAASGMGWRPSPGIV
jgi:hypothetical protein